MLFWKLCSSVFSVHEALKFNVMQFCMLAAYVVICSGLFELCIYAILQPLWLYNSMAEKLPKLNNCTKLHCSFFAFWFSWICSSCILCKTEQGHIKTARRQKTSQTRTYKYLKFSETVKCLLTNPSFYRPFSRPRDRMRCMAM